MSELKNKGHETVKENQDRYNEIIENSENSVEERNEQAAIMASLEPVDDDDKANVEEGKEAAKAIAEQLAESQMESPKKEVNSQMDSTLDEMNTYAEMEEEEAGKAGAMDGNYSSVGSDLETKSEQSAKEFNDIVTSGNEIKEEANEKIDSNIKKMGIDW